MTKTVPDPGLEPTFPSGTAASGYHLSESSDWSSLSTQMKNRVVLVCPPMLGETTLLPRKRALRTQLEPATLFQAVHIARLFNPELG